MVKTINKLSLLEHLAELRGVVLKSTVATLVAAIVGLVFAKKIYAWLQIPMQQALPSDAYFIATSPFEATIIYFKVALISGVFLASPVIFYQIWAFISPALSPKEKKTLIPCAAVSALLFTGGALFGYFVIFPSGFHYVNAVMQNTAITLLPRMADYFGVATTLLLVFGLSFELPVFIFLLGKMGLLHYHQIKQYRRYVLVLVFIVAAMLTPGPDVLFQSLLALPLWLLYELGGLTLWFLKKEGAKKLLSSATTNVD